MAIGAIGTFYSCFQLWVAMHEKKSVLLFNGVVTLIILIIVLGGGLWAKSEGDALIYKLDGAGSDNGTTCKRVVSGLTYEWFNSVLACDKYLGTKALRYERIATASKGDIMNLTVVRGPGEQVIECQNTSAISLVDDALQFNATKACYYIFQSIFSHVSVYKFRAHTDFLLYLSTKLRDRSIIAWDFAAPTATTKVGSASVSLSKGRRMLTVDGCALNVTNKVSASSYTGTRRIVIIFSVAKYVH
jgi:hypothetical protein